MGFYEAPATPNNISCTSPSNNRPATNQVSPKRDRPASGYFVSPKTERPKTGYGRRNSETPRPSIYDGDHNRPESRYDQRYLLTIILHCLMFGTQRILSAR